MNNSLEMTVMYQENDKVMLLETGEVLTVIVDFSDELERGIVVRENIGRNLMASEVRPAGHTRQRVEAGRGIIPPDPFPPPPFEGNL
jgi:hypothetical protein